MSETPPRTKLSLEDTRRFYDSQQELQDRFGEMAQDAYVARQEGNDLGADAKMMRLEFELEGAGRDFGISKEQVAQELEKYNAIASRGKIETAETKSELPELDLLDQAMDVVSKKAQLYGEARTPEQKREAFEAIRKIIEEIDKPLNEGGVAPLDEAGGVKIEPIPSDLLGDDEDDESTSEHEKTMAEMMLDAARDTYARETAKDRKKFWGRFLESDNPLLSRWIKKIPVVKRVAGFINEKFTSHEDMDDARSAYESALVQFMAESNPLLKTEAKGKADELREELRRDKDDYTEEQFSQLMSNLDKQEKASLLAKEINLAMAQDALLQGDILKHQREVSGKATKFSDWWARQKGFTGGLKKAGAVIGTGVVIGAGVAAGGIIAGVAVPAFLAPTLAGAVGGGIGLRLNSKLANSKTGKGDNAKTVAEVRASDTSNRLLTSLDIDKITSDAEWSQYRDADADRTGVFARQLVGNNEGTTAETVKGNRNRLKAIIALTALGGKVGSAAMNFTHDQFMNNKPDTSSNTGGHRDGELPRDHRPPSRPADQLNGTDFTVDYGHGYSHELQEFAQANGKNLSDTDADRLFQDLRGHFGDDFIDINGSGNDIYFEGSDVRLMEPGSASWAQGVPEYIKQWMINNGSWN